MLCSDEISILHDILEPIVQVTKHQYSWTWSDCPGVDKVEDVGKENDKLVEPPPPTKITLRPSTPTASLEHHHQGHQQENRVGKSDSGNHLVPISERETRSSRSSRSSRSAYTLNR